MRSRSNRLIENAMHLRIEKINLNEYFFAYSFGFAILVLECSQTFAFNFVAIFVIY